VSNAAPAACAGRFMPLTSPVMVPLSSLEVPWKPVSFRAAISRKDGRRAIIPGIAFRLPGEYGVRAFCLYCPHELCLIDLTESNELLCSCHSSTFDPWNKGAHITGPAPRGTFEFEYETAGDEVRILGIEAEIDERLP
jgi:Rieske Fe-S protein